MSELIVIGDDDKATAEAAAAKVGERSEQALVRLEKAAVVSRDAEGKVKADPPAGLVHAGAYGGMVWAPGSACSSSCRSRASPRSAARRCARR